MKFEHLKHFFCCFILVTKVFSQVDNTYINSPKRDSLLKLENDGKDMIDVLGLKKFINENPNETKKEREVRFTVLPFVGYTLQTRLAAILAGNIAFYVDDDDETNQSAVSTSISYTQNNQIIFPVFTNIWTRKNKFNLLGIWRYYKYPESTYGLGGYTSLKIANKLDYSYIIFREAVLRHFSNSYFYAGLGYNLSYHINITESDNSDGKLTDFTKYGKTKNSVSSGISFHALYDKRGNTINPPKGMYASVTFCPFTTLLGSNNNWQSLVIDFRKYFKMPHSKNVLAFWNYNWFTNGKAPYLDLPSTGWDSFSNIGRGYIQSRLRGTNLLYLEAEYRFRITHNGLLGGVVFSNAQSVSDWPSNQFTVIYPAIGSGIRIKLNKHSNTNLSIDYGVGIKGSKGLFINLGEVF